MKWFYFVVVLIIVFSILLFTVFKIEDKQWQETQNPAATAPAASLEPQENNEGAVTIRVMPKLSSEISFQISLNTHSEELNADLTQVATLEDENGKEYKPMRWEGDPPGGHHREGVLIFGPISPVLRTIKLVIQNIGGIAKREFLWTINP